MYFVYDSILDVKLMRCKFSLTAMYQGRLNFILLLTTKWMGLILTETQRYALQQNINSAFCTSQDELEHFFGMTFRMSIAKLPRVRMYWSPSTIYDKVADVMPLRRFEEIKKISIVSIMKLVEQIAVTNCSR